MMAIRFVIAAGLLVLMSGCKYLTPGAAGPAVQLVAPLAEGIGQLACAEWIPAADRAAAREILDRIMAVEAIRDDDHLVQFLIDSETANLKPIALAWYAAHQALGLYAGDVAAWNAALAPALRATLRGCRRGIS